MTWKQEREGWTERRSSASRDQSLRPGSISLIGALAYTLERARVLAHRLGEEKVLERLTELKNEAAHLMPSEQVEVLREVAELTRRLWKRQDFLEGFSSGKEQGPS